MADRVDGDCVQEKDLETVYVLQGGMWWAFSSQAAFAAAAGKEWAKVDIVERGSVDGLTAPPAERTVFQDVHNGHMFVVLGSKRFRIQSEDHEALGIQYDDVIGVPWGAYDRIASRGRYRS